MAICDLVWVVWALIWLQSCGFISSGNGTHANKFFFDNSDLSVLALPYVIWMNRIVVALIFQFIVICS